MKRIISLIFLSVLMLMTCSCEVATPTVVPASATTVNPTATSEATNTVPNTNSTNDVFWSQIFLSDGVFNENLRENGRDYGPFETFPMHDNGKWCPRASIRLSYAVYDGKFDPMENFAKEDFEYTIKFYYHESKDEPVSANDFIGPYTLSPIRYVKPYNNYGGHVYELSVVDCPEGQFVDKFELDKTYNFLICVMDGEQVLNYYYYPHIWRDVDMRYRELFNRYWATRDRSEGILSGMHPETEKDIQDQNELGFDENGPWMG